MISGSDQITSHNLNHKQEGGEEEEEKRGGVGGKLIFIKTKMVRWTRETAGKQFIAFRWWSSWWSSSWWYGQRPS
jgi:hypothetical protein